MPCHTETTFYSLLSGNVNGQLNQSPEFLFLSSTSHKKSPTRTCPLLCAAPPATSYEERVCYYTLCNDTQQKVDWPTSVTTHLSTVCPGCKFRTESLGADTMIPTVFDTSDASSELPTLNRGDTYQNRASRKRIDI